MSHILSMTGFSSATVSINLPQGAALQLTATLKTLNSRFFETTCKLPYSLTYLETEIIKLLKAKLHRGNIYLTVHMNNPQALNSVIEASLGTIAGYMEAIKSIQRQFHVEGNVTISDIIGLPHVFQTLDQHMAPETSEAIMKAMQTLVDQLYAARLKEGQALGIDLMHRIEVMQKTLAQLEPRANIVLQEKKQQLLKGIEQLAQTTDDPKSIDLQKMTVYNQFEKLDIHEELVRFKTHIENLKSTLSSKDEEKGKKLDFTLQELFREINTIASKCTDAQVSSMVIDIKVELEKAREQTQNIV